MDFDGLMGCEKLEIFFNGLQIPFHGSLAKVITTNLVVFIYGSIFDFFVSWKILTFVTDSWWV